MPTYTKPKNMKYTQMAMYFDEHINDDEEERNDTLLYQYLYHIVYMLASKARYFQNYDDYDDFALYAATKLYIRAINQMKRDGTAPIKSILNYVKAVLYPLKVDYQREAYDQIINPLVDSRIDGDKIKENMDAAVQADYQDGLLEEMYEQLKLLPYYIKSVVNETPYKSDPLMSRRLQMSILISFLKGVTLSNKDIGKIRKREERALQTDNMFLNALKKEKETSATAWRINPSMVDYVNVLTNKVRHRFGNELIELRQSFMLSDEELDAVLMTAYNTSQTDNNEEQ